MILGMSREDTVKKLLSPEMYETYIKMSQGEVLLNETAETKEDKEESLSLSEMARDVAALGALIMKRAIYYTPVKNGYLRNSIYMKTLGAGIEIGYTASYAIYVHEIGFYMHASPTRYKFLEDAAFEVALETNTPYRISINYDPLTVYVNVPDIGADLISVKASEKVNRLVRRKEKVWNDFINFNEVTASQEERVYHDKMEQFFTWWRRMGHGDWSILDEWQDRQRHE